MSNRRVESPVWYLLAFRIHQDTQRMLQMSWNSKLRATVAVTAALLACATPSERYDDAASQMGFERRSLEAGGIEIVIYQPREHRSGRRLHVYIEGDGSPRHASRFIPPDPTPPDPLMLRLMRLDRAPTLLLGRPCQHVTRRCDARNWTIGRYSEAVVSTMTEALREQLQRVEASEVVLIGFSGGGALAMLMAERIARTIGVVSVAGNLDVAAWTSHHGYSPLLQSLDPARRPALPTSLHQLHLQGGRDDVVPPGIVRHAIERQPAAIARVYPEFDHRCCWEQAWPEVVTELAGWVRRPQNSIRPPSVKK